MGKKKDLFASILIGMLAGVGGVYMSRNLLPAAESVFDLVWVIAGCTVAIFVHIVFHEFGHLVCGLLSGYRFVSFRAGSLTLIKIREKYCLRKFSIPGTGGQCLLDPPELVDGHYPAKLYNLGGGLFNLILALASGGLYLVADHRMAGFFLVPSVFFGLFFMATNLIPMRVSGVANDGYNLISLEKDPVASKAFWQQLRINKLQSDGYRLKEMDAELFDTAFLDIEGNPLIDQIKLFWMQRLLDEKRFDEAREYGRKLVHAKDSIQIFKMMVGVELLYLELIGPCDEAVVKALYRKDIRKWMKSVKGYPSTHRVRYAYAVGFAHDEKMAAKAVADFDKACKTYPMDGEIATERELFQAVRAEVL